MSLINNFRYGEISQKMSGRMDLETYSQGLHSIRNMYVMRNGGVSRRWPLRRIMDAEGAVRIEQFLVSDSDQYIIVFHTDRIDIKKVLSFNGGELSMYDYGTLSWAYSTNVNVTESMIRKMSVAQYYQYMYIACEDAPLARIHLVGSSIVFEQPRILLNQDSKASMNRNVSYSYSDDEASYSVIVESRAYPTSDDGRYRIVETRKVSVDGGEYEVTEKTKEVEIEGESDFRDDVLNTGEGYYPSGVAIISDRLWLYGCRKKPSTIWASRTYGSSQFFDLPDDSLLDFTQYHISETTTETIKDTSEWPKSEVQLADGSLAYYTDKTITSEDCVVFQNKTNNGTYKYRYDGQARANATYVSDGSDPDPLYSSPPKDSDGNPIWRATKRNGQPYSGRLWLKYYERGDSGYFYYANGTVYTSAYTDALADDPDSYPNVLPFFFTDDDYTAGSTSPPFDMSHFYHGRVCYRPRMDYDLSDTSVLTDTITSMVFSADASTAMQIELNTGRNDKVMWIGSGQNIFIGTQAHVWMLPMSITPIDGSATRYSATQSQALGCAYIGNGCFFISKGNQMHQIVGDASGNMSSACMTSISEDILEGTVTEMSSVTSPIPMLFSVMDDGTLRVLVYDAETGIQAWCRWDYGERKVKSICNVESLSDIGVIALVDGMICIMDRYTSDYSDFGSDDYISEIVFNRMDSMTQDGSTMGYMKAIGRSTIRAYASGRAYIFYDEMQMNLTPKNLTDDNGDVGDFCDDCIINPYGGSKNDLKLRIRAHSSQPLNILALTYEGRANR